MVSFVRSSACIFCLTRTGKGHCGHGAARLVRGAGPACPELCDLPQQQDGAWDVRGGLIEPVVDVRWNFERLVAPGIINEADERRDDDLGALIGGKRVPFRGG